MFITRIRTFMIALLVVRSSHRRCSIKKLFSKNFVIFSRKHLCWRLFLIKLSGSRLYWKEIPAPVFFCEHYKIFKNSYFEKHLRTGASIVVNRSYSLVVNRNYSCSTDKFRISPFLVSQGPYWHSSSVFSIDFDQVCSLSENIPLAKKMLFRCFLKKGNNKVNKKRRGQSPHKH